MQIAKMKAAIAKAPDDPSPRTRTNNVKTPAGRARKIADLVAMLERGETIVPERPKR